MPISRRQLLAATRTRLEGVPGLTVYDGQVDPAPPVITTNLGPDPSGRVAPYAVLYPSPGKPNNDADLGDSHVDLDWLLQVTVAAGYVEDLAHTVDLVHARLHRWYPTGLDDDVTSGGLRPPLGYDPGPFRRDDHVQPVRFYIPLLYGLTATT